MLINLRKTGIPSEMLTFSISGGEGNTKRYVTVIFTGRRIVLLPCISAEDVPCGPLSCGASSWGCRRPSVSDLTVPDTALSF